MWIRPAVNHRALVRCYFRCSKDGAVFDGDEFEKPTRSKEPMYLFYASERAPRVLNMPRNGDVGQRKLLSSVAAAQQLRSARTTTANNSSLRLRSTQKYSALTNTQEARCLEQNPLSSLLVGYVAHRTVRTVDFVYVELL